LNFYLDKKQIMNSSMLFYILIGCVLINEFSSTPLTLPTGAGLGNGLVLPNVGEGRRGGYGYGGYGYGGGLGMGPLGLEAASLRGLGGVGPIRAPIGVGIGMGGMAYGGLGMGGLAYGGLGMGGFGMGGLAYGGFGMGIPPTALPPSFGR
jgi:hypothetical protein